MQRLLNKIRACSVCRDQLPFAPRPILNFSRVSKVLIIGQAPGRKVHETGIPWDDPSGDNLRNWMGVSKKEFYDVESFAIVPMGFCYPGSGRSGDLPPRPECAPLWHDEIIREAAEVRLTLLVGTYAQTYYLRDKFRESVTETVRDFRQFLPHFFPLPHPSPRNRFWLAKNPWFQEEVVPALVQTIAGSLGH